MTLLVNINKGIKFVFHITEIVLKLALKTVQSNYVIKTQVYLVRLNNKLKQTIFNSLQNDNFLVWSKLKAYVDDKLQKPEMSSIE